MKKINIYVITAITLIIAVASSISLYVKADEVDSSLGHYDEMYDNTYLGRGYNLLENSISFRDVSAIKTNEENAIFDYNGENGLKSLLVKKTDNEVHFELEKFVCNSKLDYVNKYIKAYEKGTVFTNEDDENKDTSDDWIAGKGDIEFVKDTMNQLDITGQENVDYSTFMAYANICSLELTEGYGNCVRKEFLDDLFRLNPRDVLQKYGTHVLTAVCMGSYIESTYTLVSSDRYEMNLIEKYIADYTDNYYSKEDTRIYSKLSEDNVKKLSNFLNSNDRKVTVDKTIIARLESNKGVKYNGNYDKWQQEVAKKPLFIGASGNGGLVQLSEIIRKITPTEEYSKEMIRAKSEEIAKEYAVYASEIEAEKQKELDEKFGQFSNSCIELNAKPIAVKENCGFDVRYALGEEIQALHNGFSLGKLKMYNVEPSSVEGSYKASSVYNLKLMYQVGQFDKNLPIGTERFKSHELNYSPTYMKKLGYIGLGEYYTEAIFNDNHREILSSINVQENGQYLFHRVNIGKAITVLNVMDNKFLRSKVEAHGGVNRLIVNVLYNTKAKEKGKIFKTESQDWICSYVINFTNE